MEGHWTFSISDQLLLSVRSILCTHGSISLRDPLNRALMYRISGSIATNHLPIISSLCKLIRFTL